MNLDGLLILLIPAIGLFLIIQRRSWRVMPGLVFNVMFWFGWISALIIGIIVLLS